MIKFLIFITIFSSFSLLLTSSAFAQDCGASPYFVPEACPTTYQPDFNCQTEKILNPGTQCCPNICPGDSGVGQPEELEVVTSIFNNKIGVKSGEQIPTLINLVVTTLLGIVSVYATVMGIYIAGFVRARSTDDAEIAKANKTLGTLIAGFLLAWSFIFIIQVVANFLGLGSLSNLELIDETNADVITIE